MAFFGSNEPFSRPTRTFLDQKMAICSKICLFSEENYQERLVKVKIGPFWDQWALPGPKKGISRQYSQYGAKMPCYKLVLAGNDHFLDQWGLFRAKKWLFWTRMWFLGSKRTFFGVSNRLVTTKDFPWPKNGYLQQNMFYNETKTYQERLVLIIVGPFWEQWGLSGPKKGISSQNSQYGAKNRYFRAKISDYDINW